MNYSVVIWKCFSNLVLGTFHLKLYALWTWVYVKSRHYTIQIIHTMDSVTRQVEMQK